MNQFVVSARKYRPINFKDVTGQSHITTTLQNALAYGKLAHAFLFCGPRGVGKTSCARILAKAINCLQLTTAIEPCNHCTHCVSFNANSSMNVYELDAASHNSVEDIRELVDQVRYGPPMGKYKIYIIDEVHMLSNAAFNAFLKTLEEPPSYALFILATTERHKVLPTILSRCQIFNFHSIKTEDIVHQLESIALQESIAYERSGLQLIAQKAEGAMRDALSMFDLMATAIDTNGVLTYRIACDHLQHLDYDYYFRCIEAFLNKDITDALSLYDGLLRTGWNGIHFIVGLGEHVRNLLVCKDRSTLALLEVPHAIKPQYATQATQCSIPFLLDILTRLNQCALNYKASQHKRLHVELLLIELASKWGTDVTTSTAASPPAPNKPQKKTVSQSASASFLQPSPLDNSSSPMTASISHSRAISSIDNATQTPETGVLPTLAELKKALMVKDRFTKSAPPKTLKAARIEPLSTEKVVAILADYKKKLKQEGHIVGAQLMHQPIVVQDNVIIISLINSVQEAILQNLKEELLTFLRKELQHPAITIRGSLVEAVPSKKPYTDQEKLDYLCKKNSAVALIQERLTLEVAYL